MKQLLIFSLLFASTLNATAQVIEPVNGVHDKRHTAHVFTGATIYLGDGQVMDTGTLKIVDGQVAGVFAGRVVPNGAVEHKVDGKVIYPSFIDAYSGINHQRAKQKKGAAAQGAKATEEHWNPAIHPSQQCDDREKINEKQQQDWLASGIGIVNIHDRDGIMRGASQLIVLGDHKNDQAAVSNGVSSHFSFDKGTSKNSYPSSLVGAIALFRQTMYDAQWYARAAARGEVLHQPALKTLSEGSKGPKIFEISNSLSLRNVNDLRKEFALDFIVKGVGREYLLPEETPAGTKMILPLNFPKAWDVSDPYLARMVSLEDLKHWELAPYNPRLLLERGVQVALSRDTLSSAKKFLANLHKAVKCGLSHDEALKALTINPAMMLGVSEWAGSLGVGKQANFLICDGTLADKEFRILEHWTLGKPAWEEKLDAEALEGKYSLVIAGQDYELIAKKEGKSPQLKYEISGAEKAKWTIAMKREGDLIAGTVLLKGEMRYQLSGKISLNGGLWDGKAQDQFGNWHDWAAIRDRNYTPEVPNGVDTMLTDSIPEIWHPNRAFGWDTLNTENTFVITNATLWTSADTGILTGVDVLVQDGKIKSITQDGLFASDIPRIDAKGRHVTPGIVDEHSHIALRGGANEGGQANSAEVRMTDALDPWNFNIYRHLAGGVTTAQLLHGSANPIGGQSAIVKLKWGSTANEMIFPDTPLFIKFALGENVKRSNHSNPKGRFPLTRMGVEQSFADAFVRAKEYSAGSKDRKDLELEAVAEILDGKRHITCHSYVQSEILMLLNLADSLGFKVNTFTHILEGYKVADALKAHGASASTFSDWWAYKYEVKDAIPYNASLLNAYGVNTGINSDDAEMGRRLNQEAAKSLKYGGMTEEDAMKMVTINPAKMLHIDQRVGSIEVGKDADLVIWSDHPLSVYAKVDRTIIEGVTYYQRSSQPAMNQRIAAERARIIAKMLADPAKNKPKPKPSQQRKYHCDTSTHNYIME